MVRLKDYFPELYDRYYLSEDGTLYTDYGNRKMSNNSKQQGYIVNSFYGDNGYRKEYKRHYLVATIFCEHKDETKNQINHIDGNKSNNSKENLEWCSCKENIQHAWSTKLAKARKGSNNNWAKLNEQQVLELASKIESGRFTGRELARQYNISPQTVSAIKCRHIWADLTQDFKF